MIEQQERTLYEAVWQDIPGYGRFSPGATYVPAFQAMTGAREGRVLDAGCGSGAGALALAAAGFSVRLCDLTDAGLLPEARDLPFTPVCLWGDLAEIVPLTDWVYCCDVLEHVPTAFTMLTVSRLLAVTRQGLFLSICLEPDHLGVWVGQPLHQTVQPFTWWRDNLAELATVRECRDCLQVGLFALEPR